MLAFEKIYINQNLEIPISELRFKFARSGGRGGQNVNKVETKVELLFDVVSSPSLSELQRDSILKNLKSQIDVEGMLHIVSQESRSQWKNRGDAVRKFVELLQKALKPKKKRRSEIKQMRKINNRHE